MTVIIMCNGDMEYNRTIVPGEEGHETSLLCRKRKTSTISNRIMTGLELRYWHVRGGSGIDRRA